MEFTKDQLDSSLAGLKDLQKSLEASQQGKILQKSEVPSNSPGDDQLNKSSGPANDQDGMAYGPQYSGKEGGQASGRKDESYEKAGDYKDDDDEKMKKMKMAKMEKACPDDEEDDEKMSKMKDGHNMSKMDMDKMEKMKYSHADDGSENSLLKSFQEDGELKKAIDVSKFLGSLVEKTTNHLSKIDGRLEKSFSHMLEQSNSQNQVIQLLSGELDSLKKSFEQVLNQPAYAPRSMGAGINAISRGPDDLNKSMAPNRDPMMLKKSILNSMMKDVESGTLDAGTLIKYETTNEISEENFRHYGPRA